MGKKVYILGAGFSRSAGLPLATELTDQVLMQPLLQEWDELQEWINRIKASIKRIEKISAVNIEKLFDYCQFDIEIWRMMQHKCDIGRGSQGSSWQTAEQNENYLRYLNQAAYQVIAQKQKNSDNTYYIKQFVEHLCSNDTIISFNYDTLIEENLSKIKMKWDHGLDDYDERSISILKMHGSIDWLLVECGTINNNPQKLVKLFSKIDRDVIDKSKSLPSEELEHMWELYRSNNTYAVANLDAGGISNFQYGLGYAGLGRTKRLSMLPGSGVVWERAGEALYDADKVIAIGFSMSDYDVMVRLFCASAMNYREEDGRDLPELILIDPNGKQLELIYKNIFGPNISVHTKSIEDVSLQNIL